MCACVCAFAVPLLPFSCFSIWSPSGPLGEMETDQGMHPLHRRHPSPGPRPPWPLSSLLAASSVSQLVCRLPCVLCWCHVEPWILSSLPPSLGRSSSPAFRLLRVVHLLSLYCLCVCVSVCCTCRGVCDCVPPPVKRVLCVLCFFSLCMSAFVRPAVFVEPSHLRFVSSSFVGDASLSLLTAGWTAGEWRVYLPLCDLRRPRCLHPTPSATLTKLQTHILLQPFFSEPLNVTRAAPRWTTCLASLFFLFCVPCAVCAVQRGHMRSSSSSGCMLV